MSQFHDTHKLFETQVEKTFKLTDVVSSRVRPVDELSEVLTQAHALLSPPVHTALTQLSHELLASLTEARPASDEGDHLLAPTHDDVRQKMSGGGYCVNVDEMLYQWGTVVDELRSIDEELTTATGKLNGLFEEIVTLHSHLTGKPITQSLLRNMDKLPEIVHKFKSTVNPLFAADEEVDLVVIFDNMDEIEKRLQQLVVDTQDAVSSIKEFVGAAQKMAQSNAFELVEAFGDAVRDLQKFSDIVVECLVEITQQGCCGGTPPIVEEVRSKTAAFQRKANFAQIDDLVEKMLNLLEESQELKVVDLGEVLDNWARQIVEVSQDVSAVDKTLQVLRVKAQQTGKMKGMFKKFKNIVSK